VPNQTQHPAVRHPFMTERMARRGSRVVPGTARAAALIANRITPGAVDWEVE